MAFSDDVVIDTDKVEDSRSPSPLFDDQEEEDVKDSDTILSDEETFNHKNNRKFKHKQVNMTLPTELLDIAERNVKNYKRKKQVNKCIKELIVCCALCKIIYGENHWKVAASYANLAEAYYNLKGYTEQSVYHCEAAKRILQQDPQLSTASSHDKADIYGVLTKIYFTLAQSLCEQKKFVEAEQNLSKARKSASAMYDLPSIMPSHKRTFDIDMALLSAKVFENQKKVAAAQCQCDIAAELTEQVHGKDSSKLIPIYLTLASLEEKRGKVANKERIVELSLQAHSVAAANYKAGSVEMVDTALAVANAYVNLQDPDAHASAESYYNEFASVCTSVLGPQHPKTLKVQDHLVRLFISTNRYQEALSLLKTSLKYKGDNHGEFSEEVGETHNLIGSIYLAQGDINKCFQAYLKCHDIYSLVLGANHRKSKDVMKNIEILKSSPSIQSKGGLTKQDQLNSRPRFNTTCKTSTSISR